MKQNAFRKSAAAKIHYNVDFLAHHLRLDILLGHTTADYS